MPKLLSGRVKLKKGSQLSTGRTDFLKLDEAEPNLGYPSENGYVLTSETDGTRVWKNSTDLGFSVPLVDLTDVNPSNLQQGSIPVYDSASEKFILSKTDTNRFLVITDNVSQTINGTKTFTDSIVGSFSNSLTIGGGLSSQPGQSYNGSTGVTISLPFTGVTSGSYGSSTSTPVIQIDRYGRITSAGTTSISTTINLSGNSGTGSVSAGQTLSIKGGTGISTSVSSSSFTISIDNTVVTLSGTQELSNKTIDTNNNTFRINNNGITNFTGTGSTVVLQNSPTLITPVFSSITNIGTLTLPTSNDTLVGRGTTDTFTNKTFDTSSTGNTFRINSNQITNYTGTGSTVVLQNSPTLITPNIGSGISGISGNLNIYAASGNNTINIVPTGAGTVDVSNKRITSVSTPLLPSDAVNKQYADAIASSLNIRGEVQAATTSSVNYTYFSGGTSQTITSISSNTITFSSNHGLSINSQVRANATSNGLINGTTYYVSSLPALNQAKLSSVPGGSELTLLNGSSLSISVTTDQGVGAQLSGTPNIVDGYSVSVGDRILVKDHVNSAYNGVYVVSTVGTGSNGVWTRSTDFDNSPSGEINSGDYVFVGSGTTNSKYGFVQTNSGPFIVGTTSITFSTFTAAGNYIAGTGISISGTNISISNTYSGQSSISTLGTVTAGTWNGNKITVAYGGTGVSSFTLKGILYGNNENAIQVTPTAGSGDTNVSNQLLTVDGNNTPIWTNVIDGGFY